MGHSQQPGRMVQQMKWENLLVVIDKATNRLVYRAAWADWPQMIPATTDHIVRNWKGFNNWTNDDWNKFEIVWPDLTQSVTRASEANILPLTTEEHDRLCIERDKCGLAWRWLNVLYSLNKSVMGMIPGIDIADTLAELNLIKQERSIIQCMIKDDIQTYWHRIWEAKSLEEIESIAIEIKSTSRNSQAFG